ncbi:MAG TPA: GYD domain-containing protein [Rhodoplanes sp.]|nr:GYD domain-containing protein [Rhodoplanes sp.]
MASFILLAHFTEQGIKNVKDSPRRADAFRQSAKKHGATVKEIFWTLGQYDLVAILDAPDDVTVTALGMSLGTLGNVRTQTLRAFSEAEMAAILGKMA